MADFPNIASAAVTILLNHLCSIRVLFDSRETLILRGFKQRILKFLRAALALFEIVDRAGWNEPGCGGQESGAATRFPRVSQCLKALDERLIKSKKQDRALHDILGRYY